MGRTIIVGDVHGCSRELDLLLAKVNFVKGKDRLIFVGDLVNKGPDSVGVLERARALGATCIMGNHELKLLKAARAPERASPRMRALLEEFGDRLEDYVGWISTWPFWLEEEDFLVVHAGLVPGRSPEETPPEVLATIRTWDGKGEDLQDPKNPAWDDLYQGEKLVVFGHWAIRGLVVKPNVIGLDSGCVYGNHLSCVVLPGRGIVSVKAEKVYCQPGS